MRAVKSVSIDSERRVIITFLDGSTETLYPNCIWCDAEALKEIIKELLEEKADAIVQTISNVTVATFEDGADEALIKKLLVSIEPIQEGTGDPSLENVRPISGRTGLTVYSSGSDTSNPTEFPVSWETEAGTVYGGTLDVVSGKLTVDRAKITFDGSQTIKVTNWRPFDDSSAWLYGPEITPGIYNVINSRETVCDKLKSIPYEATRNGIYGDNAGIGMVGGSVYAIGMRVPVSGLTTAALINAWLAENPITVVYKLAEPIEYQIEGQDVTTLLGTNNIWADSGNILELEYVADTKLYIGESQSGTLGSGKQTITKPEIQPVSDKTVEDVTEAEEKETQEETEDERGE